ncbi:TPA: hypothetical protein ACF8SQ_002530 [Legionella pneumophila]|nr:hypothetical protein [Legionella pneumophila]
MEYPDTTYKVIDDFQKQINDDSLPNYVKFLKKNLHAMLYSYSVLGFRDENGPAFKKCLELIFKFLGQNQVDYTTAPGFEFMEGYDSSSFWRLMQTLVQNDCVISFQSLREWPFVSQSIELLEIEASDKDSPAIFSKIWLANAKNMSLDETFSKIGSLYNKQAHKCIAVIMENLDLNDEVIKRIRNVRTVTSNDKFNAYISGDFRKLKNRDNGKLILALFKNHYRLAAIEVFDPDRFNSADEKEVKEKIRDLFLNLFASTPFDKINKLVTALPKDHPHLQTIKEVYSKVKTEYCDAAPCFSRYVKPQHIDKLKEFYGNKAGKINDDIQFGAKRMELVHELNKLLSNSTYHVTPSKLPFNSLLPSSSKTYLAAFVLEKVSEFLLQTGRSDAVGRLRESEDYNTPVRAQYAFALPLIRNVFYFSDDVRLNKKGYSVSYGLFYNDLQVNSIEETRYTWSGPVDETNVAPNLMWQHGLAPLNATWPNIENLFAEIWSMDLSFAEKYSDYRDKLTVFYEKLAELSWLIGNTQPLERGTGSFAETVVALMHVHHGLNPPILKSDFPQLDVLNITFPLETYKNIFPYFFEPSTVPKHLRSFTNIPEMENLPISQQIQHLFTQFQRQQPNNPGYELDEISVANILKNHATKNKPPTFSFLNPEKALLAKTSNYYFSLFNKADNPEQKILLLLTILQFSKNKNLQLDIAKQICRDNFISCTKIMDREQIINNALHFIKTTALENTEKIDEKTIATWEQTAKQIAEAEQENPEKIVLPKFENILIKQDTDTRQEIPTLPDKTKLYISIMKIPVNEREENILAVYTVSNNDELLTNQDGSVPTIIKEIRDMVGKIDPSKEENIANTIIEIKRKIAENKDNNYNENAHDFINAFAKPSCCDFQKIRAALSANPAIEEIMNAVRVEKQLKT